MLEFYGNDLDENKLPLHLELLGTSMQNTDDKPTLSDVVAFLKSFPSHKELPCQRHVPWPNLF